MSYRLIELPFLGVRSANKEALPGRFEEAAAMAVKARELAIAKGQTEIAAKNLELAELFKAGKAYHEPTRSPPDETK